MTSRNHRRALTIAAVVTLLVGCKANVNVRIEPSLQNSTVQVDLVGVNIPEQLQFQDLKGYWEPGNGLRRTARDRGMVYEMKFGAGEPTTQQQLSKTDKIWSNWKRNKMEWIYIIADLPAAPVSRLVIPRDSWEDSDPVWVLVQPDRVVFTAPPPKESN